jgi:uncharacterized protein (DUF4415 family)
MMSKPQKSSALSPLDVPKDTSGEATRPGRMVSFEFDLKNPPPLTAEQKKRLKALSELPDDQIDFSDIPKLTDEFFKNALRNPFLYPPVRLDANVVEWFKKRTKGDGELMMAVNHVLLDYIRAEKKRAAKKAG